MAFFSRRDSTGECKKSWFGFKLKVSFVFDLFFYNVYFFQTIGLHYSLKLSCAITDASAYQE